MKRNSKLSLALHALGHMARHDGPMTSDQIALHNATNPVVVRRVLGLLRDHGLVRSDKGHAGGWQLAKPADQISIADVYAAIDEPFLAAQPLPEDNHCAIVTLMHQTVTEAMAEAEALLRARLARRSIADLAAAMHPTHIHPSPRPESPL